MHVVDKEVAGKVNSGGVVVVTVESVALAQRTSELAWHGASCVSRQQSLACM
jgi:hypothetical protein